jgi:hypothetical protein
MKNIIAHKKEAILIIDLIMLENGFNIVYSVFFIS